MTNQETIKSNLIKLGYKLKDCGNHWRTNAVYRGGTNPTALLIYKDTGVWTDFVRSSGASLPFKDLVSATLKTNDPNDLKDFLSGISTERQQEHQDKMAAEKIYPDSILNKLLPHYIFYNKKGIDSSILTNLKSGLATEGAMYQRYVFPIYNSIGQIHGFSGRDMLNKDGRPKWKLVGKKSEWVYPAYVQIDSELYFYNKILENKSVILVESIGDMLALHSCGIYNCLVMFGTSLSSKLVGFLLSLDLKYICVSLNNDSNKDYNSGRIGSIKSIIKLLNYFPVSSLKLHLPTSNDFGEMSKEEIESWHKEIENQHIDTESLKQEVTSLYKSKDISKNLYSSFNKNL
jgi:hypothetical protein